MMSMNTLLLQTCIDCFFADSQVFIFHHRMNNFKNLLEKSDVTLSLLNKFKEFYNTDYAVGVDGCKMMAQNLIWYP